MNVYKLLNCLEIIRVQKIFKGTFVLSPDRSIVMNMSCFRGDM